MQPESLLPQWGCFCSIMWTLGASIRSVSWSSLLVWLKMNPATTSPRARKNFSLTSKVILLWLQVCREVWGQRREYSLPPLGVLGWVGTVGCPQAESWAKTWEVLVLCIFTFSVCWCVSPPGSYSVNLVGQARVSHCSPFTYLAVLQEILLLS